VRAFPFHVEIADPSAGASIISQLIDVTNGAEKSGVAVVDNLASDPA